MLQLLRNKRLLGFVYKLKARAMVKSLENAKKEAADVHTRTGQKCLIYLLNGEYKVFTKNQIRDIKHKQGKFKGLSYADIEKRATIIIN